jgi:hypothetical protein
LSPRPKAPRTFAFPYIGHGVAVAREKMTCLACFQDVVPGAKQRLLEQGLPLVLAESVVWDGVFLTVSGFASRLGAEVVAKYGKDPWKAFNAGIDEWITAVHAKAPLRFFLKMTDDDEASATDAWHDWSCAKIPELLADAALLKKDHAWALEELRALEPTKRRRRAAAAKKPVDPES